MDICISACKHPKYLLFDENLNNPVISLLCDCSGGCYCCWDISGVYLIWMTGSHNRRVMLMSDIIPADRHFDPDGWPDVPKARVACHPRGLWDSIQSVTLPFHRHLKAANRAMV